MRLRRYRTKSNLPPFALPRGPRAIGLLLMLFGAGGFFFTRLWFGEDVLWMLLSTMVTFIGLAIIIRARKTGEQPVDGVEEEATFESARRPSGREYATPVSAPARPRYASADLLPPLAAQVTRIFRQQGAQVAVETQREDRCILRITAPNGEVFTALILEGQEVVDTAEARAIFALVTSGQNTGGYLITAGNITERAEQWAQGKPLRLISARDLGSLNM